MPIPSKSPFYRHGFAVASVALAAGARLMLDDVLGNQFPFATFFFAIVLTAWFGGFLPALLALFLGAAAAVWLFLPPGGAFYLAGWDQQAGLALYLITGLGIAMLGGAMDTARRKADAGSEAERLRDHAEAEVRRSREMLQLVLDNIPQGVFWKDRDSRYLGCNVVVARAIGLARPEAIIGLLDGDLPSVTPEQADYFVLKDREVMEAGVPRLDIAEQMTLADGRTIWLNTNKVPMHDGRGHVIGILGTWQDITENRRAEEARRASEELFRSAFDRTNVAMVLTDIGHRFVRVNAAFARMFGYTQDEMLSLSMPDITHPDDVAESRARREPLLAGKSHSFEMEKRYIHRDGRILWGMTNVSLVRDENGRPLRYVGQVQDITERKRAERALVHSEHRFRALLEHGTDSITVIDGDNNILYLSPSVEAVEGYTAAELAGRNGIENTHPDDIPLVREVVGRLLANPGVPIPVTWRRRHKEGRWLWLEGVATNLIHDPAIGGIVTNYRDITARKQAEETLRANEERLRLATEAAGMGTWERNLDSQKLYWSPGMEKLMGFEPGTFPGTLDAFVALIHPEDRPLFEAARQRAFEGEETYHIELRLRLRDGEIRWGLIRGRIMPGADGRPRRILGVHLDITDRKRAERELERQKAELQLILDTVPALIFFKDRTHRLVRVNQELVRLVGISREEIEGKTDAELGSPHADRYLWDEEEIMLTGKAKRGILEPLSTATGTRWLETEKVPYRDETGRVVGVVGLSVDVTERHEAENEILRLNAELEERVRLRTEELEAANKELEAFSYSVSHDLRGPLRAIDGFSRIVLEDYGPQLPAEAQEYLRDVRASTQQMGRLVDDLLAFSRLSRQPVRKESFSTQDLARRCLEELQPTWKDRRVEIRFGDLPPSHGDSSLLKQVWMNLLGNALKYSGKRDPAVVEIGYRSDTGVSAFFVRDNGVGFDMRYAHKLFGVFQRLHRSEDYEGTGVGLAIVQRIVHRHGGQIWAEAAPDKGATFSFTLPMPPSSSGEARHG